MPAYEVAQWQMYDRLFPFGDERDDWRMGMLGSIAINSNRARGTPAIGPAELMLKPPETVAQKEAGLRGALRKAGKAKR